MNETRKKSKPSSGAVTWIIRVVVFGTLGVLLVVAFLDFQQRQYANQTMKNFDNYFESVNLEELTRSDAEGLIVGNPIRSTVESKGAPGSFQSEMLTWKGFFRESRIVLHLGLPKDAPTVTGAEWAGADDAE